MKTNRVSEKENSSCACLVRAHVKEGLMLNHVCNSGTSQGELFVVAGVSALCINENNCT